MIVTGKYLDYILLFTAFLFVCWAPYTKVEESFNLHAIYDIVFNGLDDLDSFDHKTFPGVVKRTFVGSLLLGIPLSVFPHSLINRIKPLIDVFASATFSDALTFTLLDYQFMARLLLALSNALALCYLRKQISVSCNRQTKSIGFWFALLQFTQFHIVFYSSRTLPNFMALPFVIMCLANFVNGDVIRSIGFLFAVGIIFRLEIIVFAGILALVSLYRHQITIKQLAASSFIGLLAGAVTTYQTDTYFWGEPSLPELNSFIFNLIYGKSKDWGTEPFWTYFTKYLPRMFMIPVIPLLAPFGLKYDPVNYHVGTIQTISISSLLFVVFMSLESHKEWRFIIYAIPGITMSAAVTISHMRRQTLLKIVIILACIGNYILSLFAAYTSSFNYPGGEALTRLNERIYAANPAGTLNPIIIHTDVAACMTGVSLFNRFDDGNEKFDVTYDKTENSTALAEKWDSFDYLIASEDQDQSTTKLPVAENCQWIKIDLIDGLAGINKNYMRKIVQNPLQLFDSMSNLDGLKNLLDSFVLKEPKMFVYEKSCS